MRENSVYIRETVIVISQLRDYRLVGHDELPINVIFNHITEMDGEITSVMNWEIRSRKPWTLPMILHIQHRH